MVSELPRIVIDLDAPPHERWRPLSPHATAARELLAAYSGELGTETIELIDLYAGDAITAEERAEIDAVAKVLDMPSLEVLAANLYYDAVSTMWACTAFAVDTESGPLHARNLDWWSIDRTLERHSVVFDMWRGGRPSFHMVGWPGMLGALSGVAPGRVAITLNAVISGERAPLVGRRAVSFLLREVLDQAVDFDDACARLTGTTLAADCLLLVTGPRNGQMCVIERTPTKTAVRRPEAGRIVVTNDYRALTGTIGAGAGELAATACGRFDRASALIDQVLDVDAALAVLSDPAVRMDMTVQQMAFNVRNGLLRARAPHRV